MCLTWVWHVPRFFSFLVVGPAGIRTDINSKTKIVGGLIWGRNAQDPLLRFFAWLKAWGPNKRWGAAEQRSVRAHTEDSKGFRGYVENRKWIKPMTLFFLFLLGRGGGGNFSLESPSLISGKLGPIPRPNELSRRRYLRGGGGMFNGDA